MKNKEYNQDTFKLTSQLVEWNLDYYTIWNYRRILLQEFVLKGLDAEEQQKVYNKELMLFLQLIKKNPKSYWMWNHRIWCLQNMPKPDWQAELGLVEKMLTMDARNCKVHYRGRVAMEVMLIYCLLSPWLGLQTLCCGSLEKER